MQARSPIYPNLPEILKNVHHFQELNLEQIQAIIDRGVLRSYRHDAYLFHEEEDCAGLFVLLQGQVQLQKTGPDGKVVILRVLEPVIMFNEVPALDGGRNTASAVAGHDNTVTWQASSAALQEIILQYPRLGLGMIRVLAAHNRYLVQQYQDLTMRTVLARCAKLIYELSEGGKRPVQRRKHPSQQMAARIATRPELFSRSLKTLKEAGVIVIQGQDIEVINPMRLAEIAQIELKT